MDIIIRNTGDQPIYDQIVQQLKAQILAGTLEQGQALPSIRALAKDLRISVITTKRAYDELEKEGYIVTSPGRGSYVAERDMELVREEYLKQIETHLQEAIGLADSCGVSTGDIIDMIKIISGEEEP